MSDYDRIQAVPVTAPAGDGSSEDAPLFPTGSVSLEDKLGGTPMGKVVQPWDQMPNEPDHSYQRFILYRDMTPATRTVKAVADHRDAGETSAQTLYASSRRWKWRSRVRAYDRYLDSHRVATDVSEMVAMRKRHLQFGRLMQDVGEAVIAEHLEQVENGERTVSLRDAVRLLDTGVKLEMQSIDTAAADHEDLTVLSDDELSEYHRIRMKLRRHAEQGVVV